MPLLTVMGVDRKKKVLVSGDTIDQVIAVAYQKLGLPCQEYAIVLEQNGALIDEDEFLSVLPVLTEVMILSAEEEWISREESLSRQDQKMITPKIEENWQEFYLPVSNVHHRQSSTSSVSSLKNPTLAMERRTPLSFPWTNLTDELTHKLERGETLSTKESRGLRKIIGMHMVGTLRDYGRSTVWALVKLFTNKYPKALQVVDADGDELSDGIQAFSIRLYDHIHYLKPTNEKTAKKRTAGSRRNSDNEAQNAPAHSEDRGYDDYGCVAYEVALPDGETNETQERKRLELLDQWLDKETRIADDRIAELMKDTYSTQRKDIIDRKGAVKDVLLMWPYLQDQTYFLSHASILFGKDMKEVWEEKLSSKGVALFSILQAECMRKHHVSDKKKVARDRMKLIIAAAESAAKSLRNDTPKLIALFQLLPLYFLEDEKEILRLVCDTASMAEVLEAGNRDKPVLLIIGQSVFDENVKCEVFAEGDTILEPRSILEGFLCSFLSYYAFGYNYGEKSSKTLEFIQRVFQKISPEVGHKRGKKKRSQHTVNPQVQKLMDRIGEEADFIANETNVF